MKWFGLEHGNTITHHKDGRDKNVRFRANLGLVYYKCKFFNLFKWTGDKKLIRVGGEFNIFKDHTQLLRGVQILLSKIEELEKLLMKFV